MPTWPLDSGYAAYLVCIDVVGFTGGSPGPFKYLEARTNLAGAVLGAKLAGQARRANRAHLQFLGDEVRLAFPGAWFTPDTIIEFLDSVLDSIKKTTTQVRVVVVTGLVTPVRWRGCLVLKGAVSFKAQRWAERKEWLKPNHVIVDDVFYLTLSARISHSWSIVTQAGENMYVADFGSLG